MEHRMFDLTGMTALVTGAAGGIGSAISHALARQGARLALSGTNPAKLRAFREELNDTYGHDHVEITCDLSNSEQVEHLVPATVDTLGKIDILVNNAGITRDNLLVRMKDDEWDAIMATNLKPAFRLAKACLRGMMKARRGRIIQVGSVVGSSGNAGQSNYAAAKAALVGFTKSLAQEVGSRAITVNCVAPGFVDTDMTKALPEAQREALQARIPLGRLGSPEDIAEAVAFLAGPRAAYITGATLHVNGGMYMA